MTWPRERLKGGRESICSDDAFRNENVPATCIYEIISILRPARTPGDLFFADRQLLPTTLRQFEGTRGAEGTVTVTRSRKSHERGLRLGLE